MAEKNLDNVIEMVKKKTVDCDLSVLPDKFAAEFDITDAGVFSIEVLNRKISIEPGKHSNPDISVQTSTEILKKIINHEISVEMAFFTKKVIVTGNILKAAFIRNLFKK